MFGIFKHKVYDHQNPIFRGFDDEFYVPHSRHTEVRKSDIEKVPELTLLSESEESGVYMVMARGGREFFLTRAFGVFALYFRHGISSGFGKGLPDRDAVELLPE